RATSGSSAAAARRPVARLAQPTICGNTPQVPGRRCRCQARRHRPPMVFTVPRARRTRAMCPAAAPRRVPSSTAPATSGCSAGRATVPGARYAASVSVDAGGDLWLFGGTGYDGNGKQGAPGDLWEYDIAAAKWIWMGGSQTNANVGTYGSQGMGALGNAPGARAAAVAWMDASGNVWLFGGQGLASTQSAGTLNDLWQFAP